MTLPARSVSLQSYRVVLFRRALHPELFHVKDRRVITHGRYSFECWIMPGNHLLRFQLGNTCATEVVTDLDIGSVERTAITTLPCAGEREHEETVADTIGYATNVQTEQLPDSLYRATYDELIEFGRESDALIHEWPAPDGGRNASILDVQRYKGEVHAQSYHLTSQGGLVLRTQSLFEEADGGGA